MAQSTTNLGKIHVFPSESLYNQFKDIIASNDLALLKDDGAYIVAALLEQNGYVKFSNGLILQWGLYTQNGTSDTSVTFSVAFSSLAYSIAVTCSSTSSSGAQAIGVYTRSKTGFVSAGYGTNRGTATYFALGV